MKGEPKRLRVVLDTNILISALGHRGLGTRRIWDLVEEDRFEVFLSPFILEEFERNLPKKAALTIEEAAELVAYVKDFATIIEPARHISIIHEKDSDNRILECAVKAKADILVTGNMHHIRPLGTFQGIEILRPGEFLNKYFPEI